MEFKVIGLAHGPLIGFQYMDKMEEEWENIKFDTVAY